jgi:predicted transcriptional regulator
MIQLMDWYLSSTDIMILGILVKRSRTISQLAEAIQLSPSTISLSVKRLSYFGLILTSRKGRNRIVQIADSDIGKDFQIFINQNPNQDLSLLFQGHGILILSTFIGNGSTLNEIERKTGLSRSTISRYLRRWGTTGALWKIGHGSKIRISRNYPDLEVFLVSFSRYRMEEEVRNRVQDPSIIFNDGETILFTADENIMEKDGILPAAYTHLSNCGFDVVIDRDYYQFSPGKEDISIPEALVQAIRIDTMNPRPRKLLREYLENNDDVFDLLRKYAEKYGILSTIPKEVEKIEREDPVQKG